MNSLSLIEEAGQNLRSNWLRSLLSVIGIIIGTLTIFLILALTFTTKLTLNRQFESMGSHVLFVMQDYASLAKNQHLAFLSELDIGLLERELHGIKSLCLNESNDISYPFEDGMVGKVNLVGTQPDYRPIQHVLLTKGRFISDLDIESRDRVCVVNQALFKKLTQSHPLQLGDTLWLDHQTYRLVGIVGQENQNIFSGMGNSYKAYIPYSVYQTIYNPARKIHSFYVQLHLLQNPIAFKTLLQNYIKRSLPQSSYTVLAYDEVAKGMNKLGLIFSVIFGGLAALSLFIGGIGVMNIMLVTVVERYPEIGLRKAIGAKESDILCLFLFETIVICLVGGLLGSAIGGIVLGTIHLILWIRTHEALHIVWVTPLFIGLIVNTLMAILFGLYPAIKASKLNPVEALRKGANS